MNARQPDPAASAGGWLGEGALAQGTERYASLFTYHPHAAYSVDRHGYFTDANPRALEMTGLNLQQMRETHFSEVIHPDDVHLLEDGFEGAMSGQPQVVEARVLRADGDIVDIRCTAIPVVVAGEVVGVHGITEDVTEAKQVLRELEEANVAKSLFLATVSHEVRTPLAALVGATDLLLHAELDPEPQHYAQLVQRSSERLMRLVDDILEFSGLEARRTVLRPRPFSVHAVVEDVAEWAVPLAESRGLTLTLVVDESVPETSTGDALRVTQVVTNLVQNALTFTESGSVDVRVSAGAAPATWVEFAVADTGVGIAEDHLRTLFRPFRQVDPHTARPHRGTGLGLAICRELVDLMDGELGVRSTVGEGSTFTFRVPLRPGTEDLGAEGSIRR
ncbi:ATP-binding protein [Nocardioides sp.]|uniref:sensor histidine kinase n=1 Tax=Nocardioides sp. TaxID=35761 RepID=UPI002609D5B8|nr:ATP-binding protein [Nocardioides sp.]MCW2735870.1 domain S-box-containing protein [Nocardioides sp.]